MGIVSYFGRMLPGSRKAPIKDPGWQRDEPYFFVDDVKPVGFDSAMQVSAWFAGVRVLAETMASLPIVCYRHNGKLTEVDETYPLWRLLNYYPNRYQTRVEFLETLMLNLVGSGNAYARIDRTGGRITALHPIMSDQIEPFLHDDGSITYHHYMESGNINVYAQKNIWHTKLFGNGIIGLSPLAYAAGTLGISIDTEKRQSIVTKNGGKVAGILSVDKNITPEQRTMLKDKYRELVTGMQDGLHVMEMGMSFTRLAMSPQDMQILETRRFQLEDVARFIGVPSVVINDTSSTTSWGSGIQQIMDGFYKLNLRPYAERIEASLLRWLIDSKDWGTMSIEFDFDSLLRADPETRFKTMKEGVNAGVLTPNESREMEGRAPMAGGDVLLVNSTMVPLTKAGEKSNENNQN
jgi:HK97 family phage portal protein